MAGALMCKDFSDKVYDYVKKDEVWKKENQNLEDEVIYYYKRAQNTKVCYLAIHKYFKYLAFNGISKRKYKEMMLLHFPVGSFLVFKVS